MTQEMNDFDEMEALLSSAQRHANRMREKSVIRRTARTQRELSEDYAERLAEKATFRRLLSDEALDGVRFRWLWNAYFAYGAPGINQDVIDKIRTVDDLRKHIDSQIASEETSRGPSA